MFRRSRIIRFLAIFFVLLILAVWMLSGCGRKQPSSPPVRLQPGQRFRFVEEIAAKDIPGLERSQDGLLRLPRWGNSQPVIPVSVPSTLTRRFIAPGPLTLETAFNVLAEKGKEAETCVRFSVRTIVEGNGHDLLTREVTASVNPEDANLLLPTRIDIPARAGEEIELQLAAEAVDGSPMATCWVNPTVVAVAPPASPNIVLLVMDALRPDHLGCYGYPRNTSPWINRLASEGVLFTDASSHATWTLSSMLSTLTSTYPVVRGYAQDFFQHQGNSIASVAQVSLPISLQGELKQHGYATFGSVGGGFIDASFGYSTGYDWYWSPSTERYSFLNEQLNVLKQRLSVTSSTPFFLLLHTHEVHNYLQGWRHRLEEYDRGYRGRFLDKKFLYDTVTKINANGLSPADLQYLRDLYDGEIRCADQSLKEFFDWMLSQPWGKNTIIVLMADHGEAFGEHGLLHHGLPPYTQMTHVPLIMRFPDQSHRGQKVTASVGLTDVMPTLLDYAGVPIPDGLVGRSLKPLIAGTGTLPTRAILDEGRRPSFYAREGRWAYLTWVGEAREELYDLVADPQEKNNVADTRRAELLHMREVFAQEMIRAGRGFRIVASGTRPHAITLDITGTAGFNYYLYPTSHQSGALWGTSKDANFSLGKSVMADTTRISLTIPAGDDLQVILVESADPKVPLRLDAHMDGQPVPVSRILLGANGRHPLQLPVDLRPEDPGMTRLKAPAIPITGLNLTIWSLDTHDLKTSTGMNAKKGIPEDVQKQLKSLGYTH